MSRWSEELREACVRAALEAYEDGGIRGLCAEGRFELAIEAIRALDLDAIGAPGEVSGAVAADPRVRRLGPDDASALLPLRLRALREHPRAFLSSEEEDAALGVEGFAARLASTDRALTLGGYAGGALVAMAGVAKGAHEKARHRAVLWGVYVAPEHRRSGLGRAIVGRAIEEARALGVEALCLSVDAQNAPALALYRALGFTPWGVERDAFRADGAPVDEVHMTLAL